MILDGAMTIDTQCGIRCAGRDEQQLMITWMKPSQSRLVPEGSAITYLDLRRTYQFAESDEGIYTCIVDYGTYRNVQHIGIYNRSPGEM